MYGIHFEQFDGKWQPRPLEDEANVDKRRKEAGLSSLDEYRKVIEAQYSPEKKK